MAIPTSMPITAADRCDCCPAQGQKRVVFATGNDLIFCQHHFDTYEGGLMRKYENVTVYDQDGMPVLFINELLAGTT